MTKDELRKHCERMCARYAEANRVTTCLTYEEHKLVLDLLDTDDVLTKASVLKALEDVKDKLERRGGNDEKAFCKSLNSSYKLGLKEAVDLLEQKIKEIKHDNS